ncbi:hypothetical protein Dvina_31990 [Dactylosporangium vinaceum]|uniref:Uncharacterized protein n=1 Tax=Dactylosporangium vinaceum TaxID=53362 RepID=A0ABV5MAS8_9ACTN|nr:hypothetical protein [Dactylosporangium vinaceum]UAB92917.1 hypothetical protein Dvina_31990 [Dactylosporangium vinaceum]
MTAAHGRYHGTGWVIDLSEDRVAEADRLTSIHEMWHDRLQFTTMYGLLVQVLWSTADASGEQTWSQQAHTLLAGAVRTHEEFAAWMTEQLAGSALASLRAGYPDYAALADRARQRLQLTAEPYTLIHALNAVYRSCMQPSAIAEMIVADTALPLHRITPASLSRTARPDHRLRILTAALQTHGWGPLPRSSGPVTVRDYAEQGDDDWEQINRVFYDRCVRLLTEAGCPTLPYEGQLAHVERLHARAVQTIGRPIRLVPAGASTAGPPSDADVVLRSAESEQLRLRPAVPATVVGAETPLRSLVAGRGDGRHLFLAIRPGARVRSAYSLGGTPVATGRHLALLRAAVGGPEHAVVLKDMTACRPAELLDVGVPVVTSVSMAALAHDEIRERWGPLLTVDTSTVLVDLSPTRHLRLWLDGDAHRLRYALARYRAAGRTVVALVWQLYLDTGATSRLHIAIVTPAYAAAFEVWLDSHPHLRARTERDDDLTDRHEPLLSISIGHLLAEEPTFDFQAFDEREEPPDE